MQHKRLWVVSLDFIQRINGYMIAPRTWWFAVASLFAAIGLHLTRLPLLVKDLFVNLHNDIKTALPVIKGLLEAFTALAILIVLGSVAFSVILFLGSVHPWKRMRETVIQFADFRNSQIQKSEDPKNKTNHPTNHQALTELFAAKLRKIVGIHDLAYQYCRIHFRNQDIYSSRTCADMTSIWSQVEIKSLFFEEPTRLAIGSSPFNEDLGQISTQAGPIAATFSLKGILQFLQSRKTDNIFISGSLQEYEDGLHVVSQLSYGKKSWAWDLDRSDVYKSMHQVPTIPNLVRELAYHVTNRVMGQTSQLIDALPGDHFKKYTELLRAFVEYIQAEPPMHEHMSLPDTLSKDLDLVQKPDGFEKLRKTLYEFIVLEPTDVRSYYMLYVVGIIAIGRGSSYYGQAKELLERANTIEPSVLASILKTGISCRNLNWKESIYRQLSKSYPKTGGISNADHIRANELAKGLANVNAALGFVFEQQSLYSIDSHFLDRRLALENAENAYKRASEYKVNDPLFLSNRAEVKLRMSDLLQPKDSFLEKRLRLRAEAEQLLKRACAMAKSKNVKYAWLRMGNFCMGTGDLRQAIAAFKKAWALDRSFLVAARNLANAYSMVQDYDQAIVICQQALLEIGSNRSHFLNTKQIHGWIHNCRGWAYLRKARQRRYLVMAPALDKERDSWLQLAHNNFEESIHLLLDTQGQTALPMMNQLFVKFEQALLQNPPAKLDVLQELKNVFNTHEGMRNHDGDFTDLYQAVLELDSKKFQKLFEYHWSNHTFLPSEYLGLIEDLLMLSEYLELLKPAGFEFGELMQIKRLSISLERAISSITKYLSSCKLGLSFLWYQRPDQAVGCWKGRCQELPTSTSGTLQAQEDVTSAALNEELWTYLYQGLSWYLEAPRRSVPPGQASEGFPFSRGFPSFQRVLKADRRSSTTRRYALDLLAEAKSIGDILTTRSPIDISNRLSRRESRALKANLRLLFQPVRQTYYRAVRAQWRDWVFDGLKDFWRGLHQLVSRITARLVEVFKIITVL